MDPEMLFGFRQEETDSVDVRVGIISDQDEGWPDFEQHAYEVPLEIWEKFIAEV